MRNLSVAFILGAILTAGPAAAPAQAGKSSSSSGGRSYSAGSRGGGFSSRPAAGRSYGSGNPFGGRSSNSRSSPATSWPRSTPAPVPRTSPAPAGRGYSSGTPWSTGKPQTNWPARPPSYSPPKGKSYGSGSPSATAPAGRPPGASGRPGADWDRGAAEAQRRAESQRSYTQRPPATTGTPPRTNPTPPGTPDNSSSRPGGPPRTSYPDRGSPTPPRPGGTWDRAAAEAQRRAASRRAYTAGQRPRPNYTDPAGQSHPINPADRRVEELRRQLDRERWVNRELRRRDVFGPYYDRPLVVYHDPYSSLFWWWLLSQSLDQQARWAYHHRTDMDPDRYRDLVKQNADLENRVHDLEAKGVARDPTYRPSEVSPDLMYTDGFVNAVYNPQRVPLDWRAMFVFLGKALLVIAVLAFLVWLVFIKRWGATPLPAAGPSGGAGSRDQTSPFRKGP